MTHALGRLVSRGKTEEPVASLAPAFAEYLSDLNRNNTREWFQANRGRYERDVRGPFTELVEELIYRVRELDPEIAMEPRDAIFRIARDLRFSRDKSPYKPWMAAAIAPGGRKTSHAPGFYFAVRWDGVHVGGGMYEVDKNVVPRIRHAIAREGEALVRALQAKDYQELFGGDLLGERNKRLPPPLAAVVKQYPWVANRQFYYYAEYPERSAITRPDLADWLIEHFRAARGVHDFLKQAARQELEEETVAW
jgi:uncharacterized protein (TIGR02453 family)